MTDLAPSAAPATSTIPAVASAPLPASVPSANQGSVDPISADAEIRKAIVRGSIETFRRLPFHEVTIADVAEESGVAEDMIVRQFGTFDGLVLATVDRWNAKRMAKLLPVAERHGAAVFLRLLVEANLEDPAFMRLLTSLVSIAALPSHPMAELLRQDWRHFSLMIQQQLTADIQHGIEPSTMEPARGAEQLIAIYEGLQIQAMVRPGMDLLDSYDRAVTRMRTGWSRAYTKPVWDLS